jgi:SRSO17 transposase
MSDNVHHKEKWRMALEQIDLARADEVLHRAIVADSWYGNVPEFSQGLDEHQGFYVVGVYSNTEVFLEPSIIELPLPQKKKRGLAE